MRNKSINTQQEIEVRFLEIEKAAVIKKLHSLGAQDLGEDLLQEVIFYDRGGSFQRMGKMIRIRSGKK